MFSGNAHVDFGAASETANGIVIGVWTPPDDIYTFVKDNAKIEAHAIDITAGASSRTGLSAGMAPRTNRPGMPRRDSFPAGSGTKAGRVRSKFRVLYSAFPSGAASSPQAFRISA